MAAVPVCCPSCQYSYAIEHRHLGRKGRCGRCGHKFVLAEAPPEPEAPEPAAMREPMPARFGRFTIVGRLGAGAFGSVYRAHDPTLDRDVALKVPRKAVMASRENVERFLREARTAAKLRHPNIVPVYEAGEADGAMYIATAFIEGHTLAQAIAAGPLEPRTAAQIAIDLAHAVHSAHVQGIVHRDIKPSNVMLDSGGNVLLMDFGLARWEQPSEKVTQEGSVLGTPVFIAPELVAGSGRPGPASDQYSLGVTFYMLLCGKAPFSGPPPVVLFDTVRTPPPPLGKFNPEVPAALEAICFRMLAKRPGDRYPSCQELADALRRWCDGGDSEAESAAPPSTVQVFAHLLKDMPADPAPDSPAPAAPTPRGLGKRVFAVLGALALLAAIGFVGVALTRRHRPPAAPTEVPSNSAAVANRDEARVASKANPGERTTPISGEAIALPGLPYNVEGTETPAARTESPAAANRSAKPKPLDDSIPPERRAYARQVNDAHAKIQARDLDGARALLDACPSELRGWEWEFCDRLWGVTQAGTKRKPTSAKPNGKDSAPTESLVIDLPSPVLDAAFTPDSAGLLTAGTNAEVPGAILWDLGSGDRAFFPSPVPNEPPINVAFRGDARWFAVRLRDGTVYLCDATQTEPTIPLGDRMKGTGPIRFSPNRRLLAAAGDDANQFVVLNLSALPAVTKTAFYNGGDVADFVFSPDARAVALGGSLRETSITELRTRESQNLPVSGGAIGLSFSNDGKELIVVKTGGDDVSEDDDATVMFWVWAETPPRRRASFRLVGHRGPPRTAALSPDGRRIATGGNGGDMAVRIWDAENGLLLLTLNGHTDTIERIAFSPDGQKLASWGQDKTVRVWLAPHARSKRGKTK